MCSLCQKKFSRKEFIKLAVSSTAFFSVQKFLSKFDYAYAENVKSIEEDFSYGRLKKDIKGNYDLVVVQGKNPEQLIKEAIKAMGGMGKFVKKDSVVLVKPNIGWDRNPEQAANTNPDIVAALIDLCYEAGAKRVNVFDGTCNDPRRCYDNSGISQAAREHGANVFFPSSWNVVKAKFKYDSPMEGWLIYKEALTCDTFINVPIAKNHGLTNLTLSMKNLMGVCSGNRGQIHSNIGRKLVDLTDFINPDLTVIDAVRVLLRHGPQGGDLNDVAQKDTVVIGTDPVLTDSYACTLMNEDVLSVNYLQEAINCGFGKHDLAKANIFKLNLG